MQKIGNNAFRNCISLESISLPSSILSIGNSAFYGCENLESANIGENVKFIGISAFCGNTLLTSIDRLDDEDGSHTFDIVCDYAFAKTGIKKANLSLRSSSIYTFWGDGCFLECESLESVHILSANYLSKDMFKGCKKLNKVEFDKNFMAYTYPGVFDGCRSLTSMVLPALLIFVTPNMFKDCTALKTLVFNEYDKQGNKVGSNISLILKDAFVGCSLLLSIVFPSSIKSIDLIEDGAFNGLSTLQNDIELFFPSLNISEVGSKTIDLEDELVYGECIDVSDPTDLLALVHYSHLLHKPIFFMRQYSFTICYGPNVNEDRIRVYMADVPLDKLKQHLPYKVDTDPYYNSRLETEEYEFDGKYARGKTTYDLHKLSVIFCGATQDLGFALPYYGYDDLSCYLIEHDTHYTIESLSAVLGIDTLPDAPEDFTDDLVAKIKKKYSALGNAIQQYKASYGEQLPSVMHLVKEHNKSTSKERQLYGKKKVFPSTIDGLMRIFRPSFRPALNVAINLAYYSGAKTQPRWLEDLRFASAANITRSNAFSSNVQKTFYMAYSKSDDYVQPVAEGTPIPVDSKVNHLYNKLLTLSGFCRAYPVVRMQDYSKYKALHIIIDYKDDVYNTMMALTTDNPPLTPYSPPVTYSSDKSTTSNFLVGKWYYNAQQLFNLVVALRKPALFIYSLLGCGPCAVYLKNVWNNSSFQAWSSLLKFYMCGMEVEKLPLFDLLLAFCVDLLSPNAKNFAKTDLGEKVSDKTPNVFGEVFSRSLSNGQYSSTLMTPVLVFMRPTDDGYECWDYTFHNIAAILQSYGPENVIQFILRMCLYYFDGNVIKEDGYVRGCDKPFDINDFPKPPKSDNPYVIADKLVDFGFSTPEAFTAGLATLQANKGYLYSDPNVEQAYRQAYGSLYTELPYLGNCWFNDIEYIVGLYDSSIEHAMSALELMDNYVNVLNWQFKFGDSKYYLSFSDRYRIEGVSTPCSIRANVFIPIWTKIS